MRFTQSWLAVGAIVVSMALPSSSWAKSEYDVRITRLENIIDNELSASMIDQLESMQQEMRELRGKIEEQQDALRALNQKQEKLFVNLDARLKSVTTNGTVTESTGSLQESRIEEQTATVNEGEKAVYDAACNTMSLKQYPQAIAEFKDLLWQYPDGLYTANAHYWLGEIYLAQWQQNPNDEALISQAKESFNVIVNKYKGHQNEGDALLKLAMIEIDLEHWAVAKDLLNQVLIKHPNTSRARIAESKLQRLQQQGRI